ncbi:MAG: putative 7-carboxy-7-deazaguanine synthase QueE [Eubacteriales bacterium]|nr:putative 7-carboxy-7-deazaguanine synthase QueE [Eubacteriales bacterium]
MYSYPLVEKFISINGEGPKAGTLSAFLRMRGCNLACNYCDTAWANSPHCPCTFADSDEIIAWLTESGVKNVTLTGGEPLGIPHIDFLIEAMGEAGFSVEIETNGSMSLEKFSSLSCRPAFTLDYKCPDSGMEDYMNMKNYAVLKSQDAVKFVVSSERDLDKAKEIITKYRLTSRCHVYLSAVFGRIEPRDIVSYMTSHCLNHVHLQLQMHKFIWSPQQRGV